MKPKRIFDYLFGVDELGAKSATGPQSLPSGLIIPGNIDLMRRPIVKNPDGSLSTVRSMSFSRDGKEILIPTVHDMGYIMSDDEAIRNYDKTGLHLGIFDSPENATAYAKSLHDRYASGEIPGYRPVPRP